MSTDARYDRLVELLLRDVRATVGVRYGPAVVEQADELRARRPADPGAKLVEDVQQRLHDEQIDTTWPACPRHGTHPLWYRAGSWWCEQDHVPVASLGGVAAARSGDA